MAILHLDRVQEYHPAKSCSDWKVNNRNAAELESANAVHKAALAALKEELSAVLREKSDLLKQLSQMTTKVQSMEEFKIKMCRLLVPFVKTSSNQNHTDSYKHKSNTCPLKLHG